MAEVKTAYTQEQATLWLSRLARGMLRHGQTVFLIEQLQPSWLPSRRWSVVAYGLATRYSDSFFAALSLNCFFISSILTEGSRSSEVAKNIFELLIVSGLAAVSLCLADWHLLRSRVGIAALNLKGYALAYCFRIIKVMLAFIIFVPVGSAISEETPSPFYMIMGAALVFGVLRGGLRFGILRNGTCDVSVVETVVWSWRGTLIGLAVAAGTITLGVVLLAMRANRYLLDFLLSLGFGMLFLLPVLGAFRVVVLESRVEPNVGVRTSLITALSVSLRLSFILSVSVLLGISFSVDLRTSLIFSFLLGLAYGLLGGAWYGGIDVVRHYTLRYLLSRKGFLPLDLVAFLDFCTDELHILQRVGGGYMFLHRYLLEYFAGLGEGTDGTPASTPELSGTVTP